MYRNGDKLLSFTIRINAAAKDYVDFDEETVDVTGEQTATGTTVSLRGINTLTMDSMEFAQIEKPPTERLCFISILEAIERLQNHHQRKNP